MQAGKVVAIKKFSLFVVPDDVTPGFDSDNGFSFTKFTTYYLGCPLLHFGEPCSIIILDNL